MASTVTVNVDVQVLSGPKISYSLVESVDGYDFIDIVIPKSTASKEIPVASIGAGQVRVLFISADRYQDLKYKPKDNTGTLGREITLSAAHLFLGDSALDKAPSALVFANASITTDAKVQILVGRKI